MKATLKNLQEELDAIYPDLEVCFVSALKSEAGSKVFIFDHVRFAGLISYDNDTQLEIQEAGNHRRTIQLLAGHAIIFRGDLFHAGAAYEKENRRIYFKAIPRGCALKEIEKNGVGLGHMCNEDDGGSGMGYNFEDNYILIAHHAKLGNQVTKRQRRGKQINKY